MMYGRGFGGGCFGALSGGGWIGMAINLGVLVLIAFLVIYAINKTRTRSYKTDALDILNRKYANGEITEEEYIKKKETISK